MRPRPGPVRVEYAEPFPGMRLAVQAPPSSAASACVTFVAPAGSGFDPVGREGTALLTATAAASAAGPYDRLGLAHVLDEIGATLSHQVAPESAEFTVWGPTEEWPEMLRILSLVVLKPRFATRDVARIRRQMAERQMREQAQPSHRAERELLHAVFPPGHPYRETGIGSSRSLGRLAPTSLRAFHRAHYLVREALMVATIPGPVATIRREVGRRFRRLATASPGPTLRIPPQRPGPASRSIEMADRSQVEIRIGGQAPARSSPDYPALFLADEVLGGRPLLSRLFQRVREREGLAYYASSQLEAMRFGGYWMVQAGTSASNAPRALALLRGQLRELGTTLVPAAELDLIRESAIGELPLSLETTAHAHELAVDLAYHALPGDFWERWPKRLRAVTPSEIRRAVRRTFDLDRAAAVVVGPPGPRR